MPAHLCLVLMLLLVLLGATTLAPADGDRVVVKPADTGAALCNPDMGWVFHHYDNDPRVYGSHLPA